MSNVDERIVDMKIENKQFVSGAKTSLTALQNLNKAVTAAGNSKGMTTLGGAVDGVKQKFSLLNAAAVTAVATITNKLVNAGINMVKSLTINPILDGFREYQTNLSSIQTIMANTGKGVKTVNKYLNELNHYSDQTIYNFSEMAKNIGTFTAAGVDLKTSTASIKGIANLAALSGSNSQQASMAMYQLSQAIAAGKVGLQDWNSVVNAGMGGKVFQKALANTAAAMGVIDKSQVKLTGKMKKLTIAGESFRESIQAKPGHNSWLSSDVLVATLQQFTGDMTKAELKAQGFSKAQIKAIQAMAKNAQEAATRIKTFPQLMDVVKESIGSGWAQIFQNIFGNFTESAQLWTKVGNVITGAIGNVFNAINNSLEGWRKLGGYKDLWASFGNIFKALGNLMRPFVDAFQDLLPGTGKAGEGLASLTSKFREFTEWLVKITSGTEGLGAVFGVVGSVFKIAASIVFGLVKYFAALVPLVSGLAQGVVSLAGDVASLVVQFLEWLDLGSKIDALFNHVIEGREKAFKPILDTIGLIIAAFGKLAHGNVTGFVDAFKEALTHLGPVGEMISNVSGKVQDFFAKLSGTGSGLFSQLAADVSNAAGKIKEFADNTVEAFDAFKSGGSGAMEDAGLKLASASTAASDGGSKLVTVMKAVGTWVKNAAVAVGEGIGKIWTTVSDWFRNMDRFDVMTAFSFLINGAILLMVRNFVKKLGGFLDNFGEIGQNVSGAFGQLTDTLKTMQQAVKAKMILNIGIAIGILAAALWVISKIPMEILGKSLGALGIMLGGLVGSLALLSKVSGSFSMPLLAASLIMISTSLVILAGAVAIFGHMDWKTLARGFAGMTASLALLVGAALTLDKVQKPMISAAASVLIMTVALQAMAGVIFTFSKMNWDTFASGLVKMGAALAVIVIAMRAMPVANMLAGSAGMIAIATAMTILAGALALFGNMDTKTIVKGLLTMGVALAILVTAMNLMTTGLAGAAAMAIITTSMIGLAAALKILGSMDIGAIAKALGALTIALVIFLAAGAAATVVAGGLIALGAAIALIGVGMLAAGVGMAAFAAGLAVLVGLGVAAFGVIQAAIQVFLALLPSIAIQVAAAFVSFLGAIASASPRIADAFVKIVTNMLDAADRILPKLFNTFNKFLDQLLKAIQTNAPKFGKTLEVLLTTGLGVIERMIPRFVNTGFRIINALLDAIEKNMPKITTKAGNIVVSFINGISNQLGRIVTAGTNLIIKFIQGIGKNGVRLANAAADTLVDFLNGLATAIRTHSGQINDAGWNIASAIIDGMVNGLRGMGQRVWDAAASLAHGLPKVVQKALGIASPSKVFHQLGIFTGQGLANGVMASVSMVGRAGTSLAYSTIDAAKKALDSNSPSKIFHQIGIDVGKGFVNGIIRSLNAVRAAGKKMATEAVDVVSRTASEAQLKADAQQAKADAYFDTAAYLRQQAKNKKLSKKQKAALEAEAKRMDAAGKAAQKQANKSQSSVNAANKRADDKRAFNEADAEGKSDILNQRAEEAAKRAATLRREALELSKEADLIRSKDAKRAAALDRQAQATLKRAQQAANAAKSNAQQAQIWAAKAVLETIDDVASQIKADKDAVALEKKLAEMSDEQKAAYYKEQADKAQAESDAKYAEAEALVAKAKAEASTNANQAEIDAAKAAEALQAARDAKDQVDQYLQQMEQYTKAIENAGPDPESPSPSSQFDPSNFTLPETVIASSAVYGAQNMFDAYAKALAATAAASADDKVPSVQFIQNNTSPVALSPTEVYRQTNNLLSTVEQKLTGALP